MAGAFAKEAPSSGRHPSKPLRHFRYVETHEEAAAFNAAVEDMPISTICKLTQAAFNYEEWNLFQKLLQTTRLRTSQDGDAPDRLDIAAVAEILGALRRLETNPGDTSLRGLVATIRKW